VRDVATPNELNGNRLLASLSDDERADMAPLVEMIHLELKQEIEQPGRTLDSVWFPISSVVSLLNLLDETEMIEIATIGNEGLVGLPLSWGTNVFNPKEIAICQVPGDALVMDADDFRAKMKEDGALAGVVARYTQAFVTQLGQQVACNGLHSIEERAARWMLLTQDRVGTDEFPLTQEFLAQMLGVRRPSVTVVAGTLQKAGLIEYRHGRIRVTDRRALENAACECYRILREVFDRLVPNGGV
jgi:CRP-like cAMP-binding protein